MFKSQLIILKFEKFNIEICLLFGDCILGFNHTDCWHKNNYKLN